VDVQTGDADDDADDDDTQKAGMKSKWDLANFPITTTSFRELLRIAKVDANYFANNCVATELFHVD
jgi:hypothetical protein